MKKVCKKCGIEKDIEEFHKNKTYKDGYNSTCKECKREYARKYSNENKDKIKEYQKEYYKNNQEKVKERVSKYRNEHKEEIKEKKKKYNEIHKDEIKVKKKEYYEKNKEKINKRKKEYYKENQKYFSEQKKIYNKENKEKIKEMKKKYFEENKEKFCVWRNNRKAFRNELPNNLTQEEWDKILNKFDNKCVLTGDSKNISLEHFIPLSIGHGGTYKGNVYPMSLSLNIVKSNKNPFKWIKSQDSKIQHVFYNVLVPYLAKQNNMDTKTFRRYVNWCFKNKRTLEQIESDNAKGLDSIDLFYMSFENVVDDAN